MKFFSQKRVLAILLVVLFITALLPDRWATAVSATPSHVLASLLNPFTRPVTRFSGWLRRPPDLSVDLGDRSRNLEAEILKADGRNIQLRHDLDQANMTIARMTELRQTLSAASVTVRAAAVTQIYPDPSGILLTINIGSRDGVGRGMVVASGFCLVGRVAGAGPMMATVRLITPPSKMVLSVRIAPPTAATPARELLTLAKPATSGTEFWADAEINAAAQVGDLARLDDDSWFPEGRGLVVGKIVRIDPLRTDPLFHQRLVIEPIRDLRYLNQVEVLIPTRANNP